LRCWPFHPGSLLLLLISSFPRFPRFFLRALGVICYIYPFLSRWVCHPISILSAHSFRPEHFFLYSSPLGHFLDSALPLRMEFSPAPFFFLEFPTLEWPSLIECHFLPSISYLILETGHSLPLLPRPLAAFFAYPTVFVSLALSFPEEEDPPILGSYPLPFSPVVAPPYAPLFSLLDLRAWHANCLLFRSSYPYKLSTMFF